jgi:hypothetical protein
VDVALHVQTTTNFELPLVNTPWQCLLPSPQSLGTTLLQVMLRQLTPSVDYGLCLPATRGISPLREHSRSITRTAYSCQWAAWQRQKAVDTRRSTVWAISQGRGQERKRRGVLACAQHSLQPLHGPCSTEL